MGENISFSFWQGHNCNEGKTVLEMEWNARVRLYSMEYDVSIVYMVEVQITKYKYKENREIQNLVTVLEGIMDPEVYKAF